jgi:tetratricopeptide (TPR) repeat protein
LYFKKTIGGQWRDWIFCACLWGVIFFCPLANASNLIIDSDAQYKFACKLFEQESHVAAISEFQRFIHFFPDDPRNLEARIYISRAHYHLKQYGEAISGFQDIIKSYKKQPQSFRAYLYIADCYTSLDQPRQAMMILQNLILLTKEPEILDNAYYRMGWLAVQGGAWPQAADAFKRTSKLFQKKNTIDKLIIDLEREKEISQKNPLFAGILSVLPGAGQIYCGRYQDALSAFFVNAGLILAAVESFENELYALGATITVFEFGFYTANIYGAVTSAHKYNQREIQHHFQQLEEQYRNDSTPIGVDNGLFLSFQYFF